MALSYKEGGPPQFRPPPRLPGAPVPPVPNPMAKLEQLLIKLQIKKMEILGFIDAKKKELIAKAKEEVQKAIRAALGIIKKPQEEMLEVQKRKVAKIKKKIEKIKKKKEEIEKKIAKLQALYEKYKNLDEALYAEAMKLLNEQIAKYKKQVEDELAQMKKKAEEEIKRKKEWAIGKLEIEKKKEKIETIKKKIDNIKKEYEQVQEKIKEIQEIIDKIQYTIEHAEEEAMKYAMEKLKPILEEKKKKIEEKLEPKKKKLEKKLNKLKKRTADITAGLPNVQGAIIYQSFSAGVIMYWVGAIINPGPGVPNGIIVTFPGTPISTFNMTFDIPNQGSDPAEGIRKMVPMIKQHLTTMSGLYLVPTGTPPFTPIPWVGLRVDHRLGIHVCPTSCTRLKEWPRLHGKFTSRQL